MYALALALILSQSADTSNSRVTRVERVPKGRTTGGRGGGFGYAFFEAFPASGAGTRGVCSTTAPTGAKGETLTFTRASNATCTKTLAGGGLATTGIANGDLVVMSNDQPRVMYDANGTLGLLVESSRTNTTLRSEALDNAAWASVTSAGAVTVTADFGTAPDGASTAERVQYTACPTGATASVRGQAGLTGLGTSNTESVYVRGNGTSGNIGVVAGSPGAYFGLTCAYVSGSWTRCVLPVASAATEIYFGCWNLGSTTNSPGNTGAGDVLIWGAQSEAGAYATSYIPTVAATVTRSAEVAEFANLMPSNTTRSLAFTVSPIAGMTWPGSSGTVQWSGGASGAGVSDPYFWPYPGGGKINLETRTTGTPSPTVAGPASPNLPTTQGSSARIAAYMRATAVGICQDGTCASETAFTPGVFTFTRLMIGFSSLRSDFIASRICADPDPNRCR